MRVVMNNEMLQQMRSGKGFIAALDQSGGSTPKALKLYGIEESTYSGEAQMFDLMHQMRTRIVTSPAFTGQRVVGAILFEQTMDRQIDGLGSAEYLWQRKNVVPFLKIDKGLEAEADGVRLMKPNPGLDALLARATQHGVFGTKMRSVIALADPTGIDAVADQQFEVARQVLDAGLCPIIEPEVDIHSPSKGEAEFGAYLASINLSTHGDKWPFPLKPMARPSGKATQVIMTGRIRVRAA